MFTNNLKTKFIVILSFLQFGCHLKFNEPIQDDAKVEIQSSKCLKIAKENTTQYFDGTASAEQAEYAVTCFSQLLISLKENVKGSSNEGFFPDEIKKIVDANFVTTGSSMSIELVQQILKLKKVLVGGSDQFLTKEEIAKISDLLKKLKPEIVSLAPYIQVLVKNWDHQSLSSEEKNIFYSQASSQVNHALYSLLSYFTEDDNYKLSDLAELIYQAAHFADVNLDTLAKIGFAKSLAVSYKIAFLGGVDAVQTGEWATLAEAFSFLVTKYYHYYYFITDVPLIDFDKKTHLTVELVHEIVSFLQANLEKKTNNQVSLTELQNIGDAAFLFLNNYKVSESFATDVLNIKNAILGDLSKDTKKTNLSTQIISAKDLQLLSEKIVYTQSDIELVIHQFHIIDVSLPYEQFRAEELVAIAGISRILNSIEGSYSLFSAQRLLKDILSAELVSGVEIPEKYDGWYQVVLSLKYLVFGQQGSFLTNVELKQFMSLAAQFYLNYQEYDLYIKNLDYYGVSFPKKLTPLVAKIENEINQILDRKPHQSFSRLELESLFLSAQPVFFEDLKLTLSGFDAVLNVVFQNILIDPADRINGLALSALNQTSVHMLAEEIRYILSTLNVVFEIVDTRDDLFFANYQKLLNQKIADTELSGSEILGLQEMIRVSANGIGYHFNDLNYIRFFEDSEKLTNQHDVFKSVLAKSFARVLIRSFAEDLNRVQQLGGVTLAEAQKGFDKVRPALIELELVQESNLTFISSRFRESNLFVASSNGDDYSGLEELHDLTLHIYSGIQRADKIQDQVVAACLPDFVGEIKPETQVSQDCLLEQYFKINEGYEGFPQFLDLRSSASKEDNLKFYLSMLKAAGHIPNAEKTVQFADANLYPHVIQYIEMLFTKFESSGNRILENDEGLKAFPLFKQIIKSVVVNFKNGDKITDEQLPGVFMYLLKYKKTPVTGKDYLILAGYLTDSKRWDVHANRFDIGDIFNFIADATAPKPIVQQPVPPPVVAPPASKM